MDQVNHPHLKSHSAVLKNLERDVIILNFKIKLRPG